MSRSRSNILLMSRELLIRLQWFYTQTHTDFSEEYLVKHHKVVASKDGELVPKNCEISVPQVVKYFF